MSCFLMKMYNACRIEVNNNRCKTFVKYPCYGENKGNGFKYIYEFLTFFVACFTFSNGLLGEFVHDDIFAIRNNGDVTGRNSIIKLFTNDFWGKPMSDNSSHKSYRPITILTFRLNYAIFGAEPFYFHAVNICLHSVVTVLFTWICKHRLYLPPKCAIIAGLIFGVHPIHVEAVTGLVGRAEVLSALFFLLSFYLYTTSLNNGRVNYDTTQTWSMFVLSMICGTIAMLCKEQGIMVLVVCILYDILVGSRVNISKCFKNRKLLKDCVPLIIRLTTTVITAVCLLVFRWWIMSSQLPLFQHQDNPASFSPYLVTRCLTYPYLWFFNIFLLVFPSTLCYDWQVGSIPLVDSFHDPRNLATLLMFVVFILSTYNSILFFKKSVSVQQPDVFVIIYLFSVIPFIPSSNLVFRVGFVVAERTLYLPSFGYCILIAHGMSLLMERFPKYKHYIIAGLGFLIILLSFKTWTQNRVWDSRETLFKSGVKTLPNNAKVHYNYANILKDNGQIEDAIGEYQTALKLYPDHASAHNNLGTLLSNITKAMYHFERALQIYPGHQGALINLGARKFKLGNKTEGLDLLNRAMQIDPHNVEALMTLGGMMADLNRWTEAEHLYREAITEKPDFAEVYHNYGTYLHLKGDIENAVHYYQKAFSLDQHHSDSIVNAARGLKQLGKLIEAEALLGKVLLLDRNIQVLDMLGLLYFQMGRLSESVDLYEEILRENRNSTEAEIHYAQVLGNSGDIKKAEHILVNALRRDPNNTEALHLFANVLGKQEKHEEALVYLQRAILIQKNIDDKVLLENMYFQEGNHYKDLKQYDRALKSYMEAIILNPNNCKAHINIGAIFHLQADFMEASKHYQAVLKLEPNNSIALQNLSKLDKVKDKRVR